MPTMLVDVPGSQVASPDRIWKVDFSTNPGLSTHRHWSEMIWICCHSNKAPVTASSASSIASLYHKTCGVQPGSDVQNRRDIWNLVKISEFCQLLGRLTNLFYQFPDFLDRWVARVVVISICPVVRDLLVTITNRRCWVFVNDIITIRFCGVTWRDFQCWQNILNG